MCNHLKKNAGCVIMASGSGKRFGKNKLLEELEDKPLLCWVLEATSDIFERRIVVTRYQEIKELCDSYGVEVLLHDFPNRNDTVRLGIEAMEAGMKNEITSCMFCQGDQPFIKRETILRLIEQAEKEPYYIWRAQWGRRAGAPVVFPREFYTELKHLPEKKGGGVLLKKYPEKVKTVEVSEEKELMDIDTPEDLKLAKRQASG